MGPHLFGLEFSAHRVTAGKTTFSIGYELVSIIATVGVLFQAETKKAKISDKSVTNPHIWMGKCVQCTCRCGQKPLHTKQNSYKGDRLRDLVTLSTNFAQYKNFVCVAHYKFM